MTKADSRTTPKQLAGFAVWLSGLAIGLTMPETGWIKRGDFVTIAVIALLWIPAAVLVLRRIERKRLRELFGSSGALAVALPMNGALPEAWSTWERALTSGLVAGAVALIIQWAVNVGGASPPASDARAEAA